MVINNYTELQKEMDKLGIKEFQVTESDNCWYVFTKNGVYRYVKPLPDKEVILRLSAIIPTRPMQDFLNMRKKPIENKAYKAVSYFLKTDKKNLLLSGSVGAGKTVNAIRVLYNLLRNRKISNPLYLSVITDVEDYKEKAKIIEADAFLIDDFNISVGEYKLKTATNIMLFALERDYPLIITTNNTYQELQLEQHIKSRLESNGLIVEIKDKDYRIQKI